MRPEYFLISERLVQGVVDRSAKRGFRVKDVQIRPPFTGIDLGERETADNVHLLAEQAEAALHDATGTPEFPGDYIGMRGHFRGWIFAFEERPPTPVVWLASTTARDLVVLCGSARNVLGYSAPANYTGWRPSTVAGLREVMAAIRLKDPTKLLGYEANETEQREMANDAAWNTLHLDKVGRPDIEMDLDVLFKPYVYVERFSQRYVTGDSLAYDRVIVGAPLWARLVSELPPPGTK